MNILLQKNIWNEYEYDIFCQSIVDANIKHSFVDIIPFTESFQSEIDFVPDYIFGSGRFVNICRSKKYPTFPSFKPIEPDIFPRDLWINGDGYECVWGNLVIDSAKFIKPFTEKFFTGVLVKTQSDLDKVQLSTSFINDENAERIWVSEPKNIKQEVRFFVLYGNLITGSIYKNNGIGHYIALDSNHSSWNVCKNFLSSVDKKYENSFAIDLGLVNDEWKIIEMNNLNSSGFYKCDTDALVRALLMFS